MTAVPALPTSVVAGGKITAANFNAMVNYLAFQTNPPRFYGLLTGAATLAVTATNPIKFPSIKDTAAGWNASTGQYTCQYPGTYKISACISWGSSGAPSGIEAIYIRQNSTIVLSSPAVGNTAFYGPLVVWDMECAAGDTIDITPFAAATIISGSCLTITWTGI